MVAYEVHQQIDAYLDVVYELHQPNFQNQVLDLCVKELTRNFINWELIRYCYKRQTE